MRRILALLALLCSLTLRVWAAPGLDIEARLQQSEDPLPFGKPATLILSLSWDEKWPFSPPKPEELELPGFTVIDRFTTDPPVLAPGRDGTVYNIVFTRFEPGEAKLPAVEFETPGGPVKSRELKIVYKGATPQAGDKPDQLRGPKAAIELSTRDWWIRMARLAGAVLLGLLLLALLIRQLGFLERWLSPRGRALRQLGRLTKGLDKGSLDPGAALLEMVEVLRLYLGRAYKLVTREATSREISEQMTMTNRCANIKPVARALLERGDNAKFAQRPPSAEEVTDLIEQLRSALSAEKRKP
jgi:hypothetical protein